MFNSNVQPKRIVKQALPRWVCGCMMIKKAFSPEWYTIPATNPGWKEKCDLCGSERDAPGKY